MMKSIEKALKVTMDHKNQIWQAKWNLTEIESQCLGWFQGFGLTEKLIMSATNRYNKYGLNSIYFLTFSLQYFKINVDGTNSSKFNILWFEIVFLYFLLKVSFPIPLWDKHPIICQKYQSHASTKLAHYLHFNTIASIAIQLKYKGIKAYSFSNWLRSFTSDIAWST